MGINRASLYDTFGGKKALFDQAFELYRKTNTQGLQRFLEQQDSVRDGFRQLFAMAIAETQSEAGQKGCFVVNVTTELLSDGRSIVGVIRANKEGFTVVFHQFFLHQGAVLKVDGLNMLYRDNIPAVGPQKGFRGKYFLQVIQGDSEGKHFCIAHLHLYVVVVRLCVEDVIYGDFIVNMPL
jgi:hypothetical protein